MAFKFVAMLTFVAIASAGHIEPQQQYYQATPAEHSVALTPSHHVLAKKVEEYDPHPQYKYSYDVQDSITGDSKSQSETRNGDAVEGEYFLIDADGYKRIVHYTADAEHGFNAVVSRVPLNGVPHENIPHAVKASPVAYTASPTVVKTVQPVAYSSPSYYSPEPAHYAVQAPAVYAAPSHKTVYPAPHIVKTVAPATYASPSNYNAHSVANAAPIVLKNTVPPTHSAPSYYKSTPVAYQAAPASYDHAHESYSATAPVIVSSSQHNYGYSH